MISINRRNKIVVIVSIALLAINISNAKTIANNKTNIIIEADKAEVIGKDESVKNNAKGDFNFKKIKLTGNVVISHNDAKLSADKVIVSDISKSERQFLAEGKKGSMVTFHQKAIDKKTGKQTVTSGKAKKITYNSKTRLAELIGNALLIQNANRLEAQKIIYNAESGYYLADKQSSSKRVRIVIERENK